MSEKGMTPDERARDCIAAWASERPGDGLLLNSLAAAIRADREARDAAHAAEVARLERERDDFAWQAHHAKFARSALERERDAVRNERDMLRSACVAAGKRADAAESRLATAPAGWSAAKVRAAEAVARSVEIRELGDGDTQIVLNGDIHAAVRAFRALDAEPQPAQQGGREEARTPMPADWPSARDVAENDLAIHLDRIAQGQRTGRKAAWHVRVLVNEIVRQALAARKEA